MAYYVEKYYNDEYYMAGERSSCKKFNDQIKAENYFKKMGTKYKRGFLMLWGEEDDGTQWLIEELALEEK